MKVRSLQNGFGLAVTCVISIAVASALGSAQAQVAASIQTAAAVMYQMPPGEIAKNLAQPLREHRPLIPRGRKALMRLKAGAAAAAPNPADTSLAVVQNTAITQGVTTACTTNSAGGNTPSDINGAVGPINFITVTNVDVGVYNKTSCAIVSSVSLKTFFAAFGIPTSQTLFDPRVIYDPSSGRFIVTAESEDSGNTDQFQYIAVSQSSAGTSWYLYRFTLSQGSTLFCKQVATGFWDYPSAGYSSTRWFLTANDFPSGEPDDESPQVTNAPTTAGAILSIDKAPTLTGASTTGRCFNALAINVAPPLVQDSSSPPYFLSPGGTSGSSITRYRLNVSSSGVSSDTLTTTSAIGIPAWTAGPDAAQPNGQTLDALDGRFQSATIQNGTNLWNVHTVNIGGFARWRLYQLSTTGTSALFTFTPTTSDAQNIDHLFNASVATNSTDAFVTATRTVPSQSGSGNAAMLIFQGSNSSTNSWAYNLIATSSSQYVSDGLGNTCNSSSRETCRWGDYSATQIDPSNGATAWGFNQLITGTSQFNWTTRAALVNGSSTPSSSLQVTPATDIISSGPQGGPFSPSSFQYQLSASTGAVNFSISGIPTWLTASFTSGTVTTSSITVTFTVNSSASTLTPNTYSSIIGFTNTTNNQGNTTRNATLTINPLAPPNDNFANAAIIHENQTMSGTNVNATRESGEPVHNYEFQDFGGKSVWWTYSAALSGYVTVSTCGSSFDTVLAVYTGNAVNALTRVASNDQFCGNQSQLKFNAVAGTTYHIVVDGYNPVNTGADSGSITLSLTGPLTACEAAAKLSSFSPDGRNDIAFQNDSGTIGVWLMNGAGILSAFNVGTEPAGWRVVASGDLNGNGHADLIFRHTSGAVGVWFLNNGSFVSAATIATVTNDWHIVGVVDLNGDGMADIIWRHDSGAVGAWLMNGSSILSPVTIASVSNDWRLVGLGEISGDGKADFVWRHSSGTVGAWIMNGTSIVSASNIATATNDWRIVAIGDLNGDGRSDIVWRNDSGTVGVWFLNGASLIAPANIASVGTDWHVAAAGDINADGKADIIWRHNSGTVGAWLMNGTSILSASNIASPSNDWHIIGGEHDGPPTSTGLGPC